MTRVNLPPFQALLDDAGDDVFRFLVGTVGMPEAEDCFQETFLAALRAYTEVKDDSNLRAWVFTIAHRKVIDSHRARSRRPLPAGSPVEVAVVGPTGPLAAGPTGAPVAAADAALARTTGESAMCDLWESVRELPPKQRIAVAHRFINDLAYREIARLMGTSEEAARRNVHEALVRLREVHKT
ncbi:MAG: RNA polymerase sigma factor [Candidatus Dormiibacterota bacterium]